MSFPPNALVHKVPPIPSSTLSFPFHKIIAEEDKALENGETRYEGAWAPKGAEPWPRPSTRSPQTTVSKKKL